jgi:hypothetical protein
MASIRVRPLIKRLGKIFDLPDDSYLDPKTLGSGTPSSTKVLRGDGSWGTVPPAAIQTDYTNTFLLMGA